MADRYFTDFETLANAVDKAAVDILTTDVAPVAEDILRKHIQKDIYEAYTPKENGWISTDGHRTTYERRYDLGEAVTSYMSGDHTLMITSRAKASPAVVKGYRFRDKYDGAFLELLESGHMGIWRKGFPRPAVSNAQKEIDNSRHIAAAIRRGITREIGPYYAE